MNLGDYKKAVSFYTDALEEAKDIKSIWTNRALAYIKLKKYEKAVDDCTRILEYCECFEKGYLESKDICFKVNGFY